MRKALTAIAVAVGIALATVGCGSSYNAAHNHNAPTPTQGIKVPQSQVWHWLNSPGSFATVIYTCVGTEGYYETPDASTPLVIVPQDPICGFVGKVTTRVYS